MTGDYEMRMKAQAERIVELEQLNMELQGFYDEYIAQQEIDYEEVHDKQQTQFDKERQDLTQEKLKMKTEALMMRTQVEKWKKNVENEYQLQARLAKDKEGLVKQVKEQKDLCAMMQQEVKERNDVIQQNYITIQDLRHKVRLISPALPVHPAVQWKLSAAMIASPWHQPPKSIPVLLNASLGRVPLAGSRPGDVQVCVGPQGGGDERAD